MNATNFGKLFSGADAAINAGKAAVGVGRAGESTAQRASRIMNETMQAARNSKAGQGVQQIGAGLSQIGQAGADAVDSTINSLRQAIYNRRAAQMFSEQVKGAKDPRAALEMKIKNMTYGEEQALMQQVEADLQRYLGTAKTAGAGVAGGVVGGYMAE